MVYQEFYYFLYQSCNELTCICCNAENDMLVLLYNLFSCNIYLSENPLKVYFIIL